MEEVRTLPINWTKEEESFLIENKDKSIEFLSKNLNRSKKSISLKRMKLNIRAFSITRFTDEDLSFILENKDTKTIKQIANHLGRQTNVVRSKVLSLGITPVKAYRQFSSEDILFLEKNAFLPRKRLAQMLGVTASMVSIALRNNGLTNPKTNKNLNIQDFVTCNVCKNTYPKTAEYFYFKRKDNSVISDSDCKSCAKSKRRFRYTTVEDRFKIMIRGIKNNKKRAKRFDESNITVEFLLDLYEKQNHLCALTGLKMKCDKTDGKDLLTISLDRIDSNIGYLIGNIQLVCLWANIAKLNLSMDDFKEYISLTYNHLNKVTDGQ